MVVLLWLLTVAEGLHMLLFNQFTKPQQSAVHHVSSNKVPVQSDIRTKKTHEPLEMPIWQATQHCAVICNGS